MSGITPIIDTLLHQVLGRRDAPIERPLPETLILPAQPGHAAAKAYSDSRLDPRALLPAETESSAARKLDTAEATQARTTARAEPGATLAATIRFSGAARTIAEILARFPAPPSALRIAAPLLAHGEPIDAARLALLLRASIETSGLFYESHLARWRSGDLPLQRLLSEPQMLWTAANASVSRSRWLPGWPSPTAPPATPGGQSGAPSPTATAAPAQPGTADGNPPTATLTYAADGKAFALPAFDAAAVASGRGASDAAAPTANQPASGIPPGLDGILRHQLELLAAPVLHWQGAPWSGAFMTLTLQPPAYHQDDSGHPPDDDADRRRADPDAPWQSQLVLQLPRLGQVTVDLQLRGQRVALDLAGPPEAAASMQARSPELGTRLRALGFNEVAVHVRADAAAEGGIHA